ncbi:hypothetical protein PVL29_021884 [Vitis rotundifolia]|uniref:Transmembrane protein n=1 Tax=Vitis rotundifolia TaxID=103349 RepID=A0AA38YU99_VITRO|nr:hypothetical protein PVL29_021884 [Vitis rotundifolia]
MDAATIRKIQAMKRYRNHQLLNKLFFYTVTALICSLLCSSPFWLPSLSLPKLGSLLFSSKSVFVIVGSLIIIFLVGDSKALTSESPPASEVYYDEYVSVSRNLWSLSGNEEKGEMKGEKFLEEKVERYKNGEGGKWKKWEMEKKPKVKPGGEENLSLPELNKRADDFIARVNRQRRLEAKY